MIGKITDAFGLTDSGAVKKSAAQAEDAFQQALQYYKDLGIPDVEAQKIALEELSVAGILDPTEFMLGESQLANIQLDPSTRERQMQTMGALEEISKKGLTDEDKMAMENMLGQVASQEKSQRAGLMSEMQRKGTADSGSALLGQLLAGQSGANQARNKAMQMAAQGQNRRMSALQNIQQMAGQMEGADWQRKAQQASAADKIAQYNAMQKSDAARYNLGQRQRVADQNVNLRNQQEMYNKGLLQQKYQNELQKAQGMAGVSTGLGNMYQGQAQAQAGADAATTQGLFDLGANIYTAGMYGAAKGAAKGAADGGIVGYQDGGLAQQQAHNEVTGIAQEKEMKAHEKFKRDYMKRVREELTPQKEARKEVTGVMRAEDGGVSEYGCGGTHKAENGDVMYASDGYGDIVDSGMESYAGDRVDAKINDGEMILNVPQQQRLMDIIRGTEDLTALGDEDIIEGVPRDYRDELHEKGEESGSDKKIEGLKSLLEALGEN